MKIFSFISLLASLASVLALKPRDITVGLFPFESIQLQESDLAALEPNVAALFNFANATTADASSARRSAQNCKVFPGDPEWPADHIWDIFNVLLGGALIKTVPIAAPCYNAWDYNAARCEYVTDNWTNSSMHELDPTSMMTPLYQGLTCQPTTNPNDTCTLGGYPSYAINATNVKQIQLAINFARSTGIRLVIRNTGHDFGGKSGGAGSLAIWTHYLNTIDYLPNYVDEAVGFSGPAFKAGSGVIGRDIYVYAAGYGLAVFGGEAADVGVFGGYSQGGGHGPLISTYGPGADQILSAEVVTADGQFITASSTENTDLFWALRGGGGGTWGVVTSMTVRAFPSTEATVAVFTFSTSNTTSSDTFWAGVKGYWDNIPTFADAGVYCYFFVFPFEETTFYATFFAPNRTIAGVQALAQPFLDNLAALDIPITPTINTYPSIYLGWKANFPQEAVGTDNVAIGSRLFPRDNWADPSLNNATFDAWSASGQEGSVLIGMNCAAPNHWGVDNAVLPAWRNSVLHSMQGTSWDEGANGTTKVAACELLAQRQALWKSLTPNSGAYLNECDIRDEDFQQDYYGANYPRLLSIKHAVDPWNLFWAKTAVGSEVLSVVSNPIEEAIGDENGRLCYT